MASTMEELVSSAPWIAMMYAASLWLLFECVQGVEGLQDRAVAVALACVVLAVALGIDLRVPGALAVLLHWTIVGSGVWMAADALFGQERVNRFMARFVVSPIFWLVLFIIWVLRRATTGVVRDAGGRRQPGK